MKQALAMLAFCLMLSPAAAQQPALPAAGAPAEAPKDITKDLLDKETAVQPGQYTYLPAGRRDPFVSLLVNVGPSEGQTKRPNGMPGFLQLAEELGRVPLEIRE
jgi:hypothetical protein